MNKVNFIIALSMLAPMFASNPSGSFGRTTPLLSSLRKMRRRGYRLVVVQSEDNKDRVHFAIFSPKMKRRLAEMTIVPGFEAIEGKDGKYTFIGGAKRKGNEPTYTYNVQGSFITPHLRGMGKALYFAVLLWTTNQKSWLGADVGFSVDPNAQRIYKFWKKDPNIESITKTDLGFPQAHLPSSWLYKYFREQMKMPPEQIWEAVYAVQTSKPGNFLDQHREELEKLWAQLPIRHLYKLKPNTYPKERALVQSMMSEMLVDDFYNTPSMYRPK